MTEKIHRTDDRSRVWVGKFIRPEQEAAIQRMMEEGTHAVCNGSDMDTGKSMMTVEFILRMGFDFTLTTGVKDSFAQWRDRLEAQSDGAATLLRIDSTKAGKANFAAMLAGKPGHYFGGAQYVTKQDWGYKDKLDKEGNKVQALDKKTKQPTGKFERVRYHLFTYKKMKRPLDLLVSDEIHIVANAKSLGRRTLGTIPADWKMGLSGTWYGGRFPNAHSVARWLWGDLIEGRFATWRDEYCVTETPKRRGGLPVEDKLGNPVLTVTGERVPGRFVSELPCYVRLSSKVKVPPAELVMVDLLPQQRADYDALEEDGVAWLQAHPDLEPLITSLPIVKRLRMRQATLGVISWEPDGSVGYAPDTRSTKLYALRTILDRPDWTGRQVAIYVDSKKFAKITVARMRAAGYMATEWSGDVDSKGRDDIKRRWLAGEIPFLVAVVRSFNAALDGYQDVCNRVIWLSEDDNNTANQQAIKRFCRSGNDEMLADFQHVKIVARDTLDLGIFRGNKLKTQMLAATVSIAA